MELEIDYSAIPQTHVTTTQEDWEPPVHKFFGKKDPQTGKMEKEPTYYHQEYPRVIYKLKEDGKPKAVVVNSDQEFTAMGEGWTKSLSELGVITCPSFEQRLEMQAAESNSDTPRVGRPKKVA